MIILKETRYDHGDKVSEKKRNSQQKKRLLQLQKMDEELQQICGGRIGHLARFKAC